MILKVDRWLANLCDPKGPRTGGAACDLREKELVKLRHLADRHGVLPAVAANLQRVSPESCAHLDAPVRLTPLTAMALFLRVRVMELYEALCAKKIPAVVIKGPVMAARAYRPASLRTYIDIDLLVPRAAWEDVRGVMQATGFEPAPSEMKHDAEYGEEGWMHGAHPGCSFEVHWNLVNSPIIRKAVSVTYEDLNPKLDGKPLGNALSPAALLLIAAVHAAASHEFDKLQHACDIAQIARGAAGKMDAAELAEMTRATHAELAVATGLKLAGEVLQEPACAELLAQLKLNCPSAAMLILSAETVICGQSRDPGLRLRRRVFREALKHWRV
jgi:hypothetical protein